MIRKFEIERFSVVSNRGFDEVIAAIDDAIGHPDLVARFLVPYENPDALAVAKNLDHKVETLLQQAAG